MQIKICPELLEKYESLKAGKVYYGEFAKDTSLHGGVVLSVVDGIVHVFCITSSERFIQSQRIYDPQSIVEVPSDIVNEVFSEQQKPSWVYCGKANHSVYSEKEFLSLLSEGKIAFKCTADDSFFEKVKNAVRNSVTYTSYDLSSMGVA